MKGIRELYKINLGVDNNERLLRAQGALFFIIRNNGVVREMLLSEYEKRKEILPFVIVG